MQLACYVSYMFKSISTRQSPSNHRCGLEEFSLPREKLNWVSVVGVLAVVANVWRPHRAWAAPTEPSSHLWRTEVHANSAVCPRSCTTSMTFWCKASWPHVLVSIRNCCFCFYINRHGIVRCRCQKIEKLFWSKMDLYLILLGVSIRGSHGNINQGSNWSKSTAI